MEFSNNVSSADKGQQCEEVRKGMARIYEPSFWARVIKL